MGGMAVAARLSTKRHQVTVVEQSTTYGGKLGVVERDGFVFDTGPSLLTLPAVYRDLFNKTGALGLDESVDLQELDPAFGYRCPESIPRCARSRWATRSAALLQPTGTPSSLARPTCGSSPGGP